MPSFRYENCSNQNEYILRQIIRRETHNTGETSHCSKNNLGGDDDENNNGKTLRNTFNGDVKYSALEEETKTESRLNDGEIIRRSSESFDILLAPAKNPTAIQKMSTENRLLQKLKFSDIKVKAVENAATQTDALLFKNIAFEVIFEKHKKFGTQPKLSSAQRTAKYEDPDLYNFDEDQQQKDYISTQSENNKQITLKKQYQQTDTEIDFESVIKAEDEYGYSQWTVCPLLPFNGARTPIEMSLVPARDTKMKIVLSHVRNEGDAFRVLDKRKAIKHEPERFRFSRLHRFSERSCRIPIMIAINPPEKRGVHLHPTDSRIPIRIKGYMWGSMVGKTFPKPVRSFPGCLIPVITTT